MVYIVVLARARRRVRWRSVAGGGFQIIFKATIIATMLVSS